MSDFYFTDKFSIYMQRFELIKKIGSGAYSEVFKAWDYSTSTYVAIKQTNHTNPDTRIVLNRQIQILNKFNHPNIVKLLGCYNDKCYTYLILEYLPYDLITYYKQIWREHRRRLSDRQITTIFYQICEAIGYMHNTFNIMHRDVKPENVLIDPITYNVKIIDFGFATQMNFYKKNTEYMVTRWYRPLEIVLGLPYDMKIDVFALGALLLELYLGEEVFKSASNLDQLYWIYEICGFPNWEPAIKKLKKLGISLNPGKQPAVFQMTKQFRFQASNLIIGMLQPVPLARLNLQQVLSHQYFSQYNLPKKRIVSEQLNNSCHQPSQNSTNNPHNFHINLSSLSGKNSQMRLIHSDRQHNQSRNKAANQSNQVNYQSVRRKTQMHHSTDRRNYNNKNQHPQLYIQSYREQQEKEQLKRQQIRRERRQIEQRQKLKREQQLRQQQLRQQQLRQQQIREMQQMKKIQLQREQQLLHQREQSSLHNPYNHYNRNIPVYQSNSSIQNLDHKREARTKSLRIQVLSLKKNPSMASQEYYTPKNQKQHLDQRLTNAESQKKFIPLKLRPNLYLMKRDPAFTKMRNKIFDHNTKNTHKTKISLSNRFFTNNAEDRPEMRSHIGLQIAK